MFCLIFWINAWGSLIFDIEMIIFCGVIFCWNFKNYELVNVLPIPLLGIPNPFPPKAVLLTNSFILLKSIEVT